MSDASARAEHTCAELPSPEHTKVGDVSGLGTFTTPPPNFPYEELAGILQALVVLEFWCAGICINWVYRGNYLLRCTVDASPHPNLNTRQYIECLAITIAWMCIFYQRTCSTTYQTPGCERARVRMSFSTHTNDPPRTEATISHFP